MKLKLTDSPGIAGGFYWIHQKEAESTYTPLLSFGVFQTFCWLDTLIFPIL